MARSDGSTARSDGSMARLGVSMVCPCFVNAPGVCQFFLQRRLGHAHTRVLNHRVL